MPSRRHEHDRACRCERADGGCAALAVQRLSRTRVQELAEEIWTVSTGTTVPVQPLLDPRGSRPGASAHAAYRRCRHKEREQWRDRWWWPWRSAMVAAAALGVGLLAGSTMGPWLGWRVAMVAGLLVWWRLAFRPSATARFWRRQAVLQRRTAGMLAQLEQEGWLVLHDVALPGWSASLDHLAIGPTGAWAIDSWRNSPRPDLSWKAEAVADSLVGTGIPVRRPETRRRGGSHGPLSADRRAWAHRRPPYRRAGHHRLLRRLVLLPAVRLAQRVCLAAGPRPGWALPYRPRG
jgi:hypothetical protein